MMILSNYRHQFLQKATRFNLNIYFFKFCWMFAHYATTTAEHDQASISFEVPPPKKNFHLPYASASPYHSHSNSKAEAAVKMAC